MKCYCNADEDFIVGIYEGDRDSDVIARLVGKVLDVDLVECSSPEYEEFEQNTFSHDTLIIKWNQLAQHAEDIDALESKKINLYVVF